MAWIITSVSMVWAPGDRFPVMTAKHFLHPRTLLEKVKIIQTMAGLAVGFSEPHLAADAPGIQRPLH